MFNGAVLQKQAGKSSWKREGKRKGEPE